MKNICNTRKNGLSPLARGARHSQADPATALRFIPAGAGNTPASSVYSARSPVYPRWRGEHFSNLKPVGSLFGLSPLARGTQSNRYFKWPAVRFIPAGAGNTEQQVFQMASRAVYPRWRGNSPDWHHAVYPAGAWEGQPCGLSPLARGTQSNRYFKWPAVRFIPAGAGNSPGDWRNNPDHAVYPRWRGELVITECSSPRALGLSPLARGTPRATSATRINNRFIPAGAGNSHGIWQTSSTCTVYPRWRGELDSKPVTRTHQPGLSPLARGTPL